MINKLYQGDNINVMRSLESKSIDLICADPPFNSGRDYNNFKTDKQEFTDRWAWDDISKGIRRNIADKARNSAVYATVNNILIAFDYILDGKDTSKKAQMKAYLTFMAPRLAEMQRLLKDTGSLYLHCDHSANHYLKILLEGIFGTDNFRNEITWSYHRFGRNGKYQFPRMNDTIFFFSKEKSNNTFHKQYTTVKETSRYVNGYHSTYYAGRKTAVSL